MGALSDLLLDLLSLMCVTGEEGPIADWLEQRYRARGERVRRVGHSVVVGERTGKPAVLLVGHTDVVPPTDADVRPRREDGRIIGRGASDMKAGLAVAMRALEDADLRNGPYDLLLVAYAGEEGTHADNELGTVLEAFPDLREAELAVVLEPTDLTVQLGCVGAINAEVRFRGRAAHAARPWLGSNALSAAGRLLAALHERPPRDVGLDGLVYREVITPTLAWTGEDERMGPRGARNVVPERFTTNVNYRFAPDTSPEEAEAHLRALVGDDATVTVVDRAPAAPPSRDAPLVAAFIAAVGAPVEAKQAWTDVARLAQAGVPALNYGPGLTGQAHKTGEYVPDENLGVAFEALAAFLSTDVALRGE